MLYEQKMLQVSFWFVTSQSNDVCGFGPGLKLNLNYMAEYTMLYLVIQSQMLFFRVILHYVLVNTHTYIIYFLYTYIDIYICKIPFILVVSSTKSRITCTWSKQYEGRQTVAPFLQTDEQFQLTGWFSTLLWYFQASPGNILPDFRQRTCMIMNIQGQVYLLSIVKAPQLHFQKPKCCLTLIPTLFAGCV